MIGVALKRLATGSLIYGMGGVIQRFVGLLLLPIFTSILTPEDYGAVALISLISIAISGFLTLGTGNSLGLLYFKQENLDKRRIVIWTNVVLMAFNGLVWYILLWLIAPLLSKFMFQTNLYADHIRIAVLGSVFQAMVDPWLAFLRMEQLAKKFVLINLGGAILTAAISVFLVVYLRCGVIGLLAAGSLGSFTVFGLTWFIVGRNIGYNIEYSLFSKLVRVGFPSILGSFAFLLIDYADRQMIERILGLAYLGTYSVGYSFGIVIMIAVNAFASAWSPFFMSYVNKQDDARKIFGYVLTYYTLSFGSLIVLFFFTAKPFTIVMTAPKFHDAWVVVGLVSAAYVLKGCYLIILPGIYFSHKLKWQSIIEWIAALLNILLNIYLIPRHGIFGAAIATFISYLSLPILAWIFSRSHLRVDYEWARLVNIILLILSLSIFGFWFSLRFNGFDVFGFSVILFSIITYMVISFLFILRDGERRFFWDFFHEKK